MKDEAPFGMDTSGSLASEMEKPSSSTAHLPRVPKSLGASSRSRCCRVGPPSVWPCSLPHSGTPGCVEQGDELWV